VIVELLVLEDFQDHQEGVDQEVDLDLTEIVENLDYLDQRVEMGNQAILDLVDPGEVKAKWVNMD
jgi:hypothetical protein